MKKLIAKAIDVRKRLHGGARVQSGKQALALPHEGDERTQTPGPARRVMLQAAADLHAGLVDTDNYTRAASITAGGGKRRRGHKSQRKAGR